ncbi:unnamed protein product [Leptidea sinapis]|uniref:Uncharacterized protein n=1 Tax=Leptidea sinapis TaxID=189913 RepID=A0A5E4QAF9_9NEOP|nr:unnamed protein product [Leptidea sinapis]
MSQAQVTDKQEMNRRTSQDVSETKRNQESTPKKDTTQGAASAEKPKDDKELKLIRNPDKNPFSPNFYRGRTHGQFDVAARGADYSPHRVGMEVSNRLREFGPQRSTSIHGHELTDGPIPMKPEYLGHRNFGSQIVPGLNHPDVVFRHDYYGQVGFSPPRTSRFSSQEYLNAPNQYGRWDYRAEYRQRRRSQQDLQSIGHSPESGMSF